MAAVGRPNKAAGSGTSTAFLDLVRQLCRFNIPVSISETSFTFETRMKTTDYAGYTDDFDIQQASGTYFDYKKFSWEGAPNDSNNAAIRYRRNACFRNVVPGNPKSNTTDGTTGRNEIILNDDRSF